MRIAAIDRIETLSEPSVLPLTIKQHSATLPACALVLVSTLSIVALLMPIALVASHSLTDAHSAAMVMDRPATTAAVLAALLCAVGARVLPLRAGLGGMRLHRAVRLAHDTITVEDDGLFGQSSWHAPFSQFTGVTHHIRATLSGPRHEIILVHPDRNKDVLLNLSPRSPEQGAEQFARVLGLDVIHAGVLYGRRRIAAARRSPQDSLGLSPAAA